MTEAQLIKNLMPPKRKIDVILDTDAYNEIDDQYAISYMLRSQDRLNIKGICAAPFKNSRTTPDVGMEQSYNEILNLLTLANEEGLKNSVYRGSTGYLTDESTPVESDAASFIAKTADDYSPENPLYIVSIGASTNVASAILKNPKIKENAVIVWLCGNALHIPHNMEYNLMQDIHAARLIFGCGVPLVQLPCGGIVDKFYTSKYELLHHLGGKNKLCDYLVSHTIEAAERHGAPDRVWTRVIWDVTAVGWLLNDDERFMSGKLIHAPIPEADGYWAFNETRHFMSYVYYINRDALFTDLFNKLAK